MMRRKNRYTWLRAATMVCLMGCGGRPAVHSTPVHSDATEPQISERLEAAEDALKAGNHDQADRLITAVIADSNEPSIQHKALYVKARIQTARDIGQGADALAALVDDLPDGPLKEEVRRDAIRTSLDAKRCLTAERLLGPIIETPALEDDDLSLVMKYSQCLSLEESYPLMSQLSGLTTSHHIIESELIRQCDQAPIHLLVKLMEQDATPTVRQVIVDLLARRSDEIEDRAVMEAILRSLDEEHPYRPRIEKRLSRPKITILLPLTGRARHSGITLKNVLSRLAESAEEDRVDTGAILEVVDAGTEDTARSAIKTAAEDQRTFALIGLFETGLSRMAAEVAQEHGVPMLMMTHKSGVTKKTKGIWRIFPTPLTVARNLASAALKRGGQKAIVAYAENPYGRRYASWFKRVWKAAPGTEMLEDVSWPKEARDYEAIAEQIARTDCDTLFLPIKPKEAALLLRHLAAKGIWARGLKPRFAPDEDMREVTVMAPPEWYDVQPGSVLSHYGDNILIPVAYAAENRNGQIFSQRVNEQIDRQPSTNLAVLLDAVRALESANQRSMDTGEPAIEAIQKTTYNGGATAGFSFARKEAVNRLFLMTLKDGVFRPAQTKK